MFPIFLKQDLRLAAELSPSESLSTGFSIGGGDTFGSNLDFNEFSIAIFLDDPFKGGESP